MQFEGIYPPVMTPFNSDLTVDWDGFARLLDFLIEQGVHGLILGGTTGEFYAMTREERIEQFKRGKEIIAGRLPMIAGVNALNAAECPDYARAARDAGADALLVAAPPYSQPTQEELAAHCLKIEAASGLPIMLYNYPGRVGMEMEEAFLDLVADHKNIVAIKEASGDINRVHLLANNYPNLQLSIGAEDQALEFFAWGARSWVSPIPNFLPMPVVKLYEACALERDFQKGRRLMETLMPITTILERSGKYLQSIKAAARFFDLPAGPVRPPLQDLEDEKALADLHQVLDTAQKSAAEVIGAR
ncbi:MAG: dihydrodipicolinate synthase family protein [Pseudomonadota bacterium]